MAEHGHTQVLSPKSISVVQPVQGHYKPFDLCETQGKDFGITKFLS